ncbi:alpha amylase catalytic region [Thalassoporum mexicanum PCC 7367]|uniref:alpha-amylase family glycosyl hydrolase n=1 Tax=Thalassoporum mexicanum TaxID=3457544 RepID=UPI00029FDA2E|nr:alpha-amylase family glycosyl hydrolase [Pseudanabaena sp. PCC 7367]AFY68600.1 alpha amylase catalytic region [Pseudanabaena sp. PCC 7367]
MADHHSKPVYPLVYQINTRVWLQELSQSAGRSLTLAEIPADKFAKWQDANFDLIWLMGVWQPSQLGKQIALEHPGLQKDYDQALPDWQSIDVVGSPYAIAGYEVAANLGGNSALAAFRQKLASYGLKLMLDFVPNHTALDHHWVNEAIDVYMHVPAKLYQSDPEAYYSPDQQHYLARGKDPYFPAWTDTLQLNYGQQRTRELAIATLQKIASQCDAVRCDMAMLLLKDIFNQTWADLAAPMQAEFWDQAIAAIKATDPDFLFVAEAYWEKEWQLQQLGFDYTYDKQLYDRLVEQNIDGARLHLLAEMSFQAKLVRFIENHDEPRAAKALGSNHKPAALITLTSVGMHLIHEGQMRGWQVKLPVQLARRPQEQSDRDIVRFYDRLLPVLASKAVKQSKFELINFDGQEQSMAIAFKRSLNGQALIVVANFGDHATELSFEAEPLAKVTGYGDMDIISTEAWASPQFDLWPGGITLRLRPHEGLAIILEL